MTLLAITGGDTALIILAAFWGLLVLALCVVLLNTFRVLEHEDDDRHDARGDGAVAARGQGVGRTSEPRARPGRHDAGERHRHRRPRREALRVGRAGCGEPLVKVISMGAGLRQGFAKARGRKK